MEYDIRSGNFTFKHITDPEPAAAHEKFKEHYHTVYELLYFLEGDADFAIQHTLYRLKPHCLLVIKPGELHNLVVKSGKRYERIVLRFGAEAVPGELRERLDRLDKVYFIKGSCLSQEIFRLDRHCREVREDMRLFAFQAALNVVLAYLVNGDQIRFCADEYDEEIARIMHYIADNLPSIHTSDDLCRALHMSKSTLKKVFSDHFQTPVMSYVRTLKCMAANAMLADGVSATDAGSACGFQYYSSFYRAYVQVFGHPPSERRHTSA